MFTSSRLVNHDMTIQLLYSLLFTM